MLRFLLLVLAIPALLAAAACGGGGDDNDPNSEGDDVAAAEFTVTPTPKSLPTPRPAVDNDVILSVSAGENAFNPTLAEFRALPTTKIDANGEKEGVSLALLAEKVGAPADTSITLQGYRPDGRKIAFVRRPLSEIGAESVLMVDENGWLKLASSQVPEDSWLINVTMVTFP